jgi:hypothetical protein
MIARQLFADEWAAGPIRWDRTKAASLTVARTRRCRTTFAARMTAVHRTASRCFMGSVTTNDIDPWRVSTSRIACMRGASGFANSSQLLLRKPSVGMRFARSSSIANGFTVPPG